MIPTTFFDEKTFEKTIQAHQKGLKVLSKANELLPTLEVSKMTKEIASFILYSFEPEISENPIFEAARANLEAKFTESGLTSQMLFKSTLIELEKAWNAFFHAVDEVRRKEFRSTSPEVPTPYDCDISNFVIGKEIKLKPDFEKNLKKALTYILPDECKVLVQDFETAYINLQTYLSMVYGEGFHLVGTAVDLRIGNGSFLKSSEDLKPTLPERFVKIVAENAPQKVENETDR